MAKIDFWRLVILAVSFLSGLGLLACVILALKGGEIPSELSGIALSGLSGLLGIFKSPEAEKP
jgi:hypothetical protein